MNKLTAEKCRYQIKEWERMMLVSDVSIMIERHLEAYRIALPVLEQQESQCQKCGGTGMADSGGTQPWGEQILVECDCQFELQEMTTDIDPVITDKAGMITDSAGWIEWKGGERPVTPGNRVDLKLRGGVITSDYPAECAQWSHHKYNNNTDIIAYRVIENDGREDDPLSRRTNNT